MPTVATYYRSATDEADGIAARKAALAAWLSARPDHTLVGAWSDAPCSGLTPPWERQGFGALLAHIAEHRVDLVLVPAAHPYVRDRALNLLTQRLLQKRGAQLVAAHRSPGEARSSLLLDEQILALLDEYQRKSNA